MAGAGWPPATDRQPGRRRPRPAAARPAGRRRPSPCAAPRTRPPTHRVSSGACGRSRSLSARAISSASEHAERRGGRAGHPHERARRHGVQPAPAPDRGGARRRRVDQPVTESDGTGQLQRLRVAGPAPTPAPRSVGTPATDPPRSLLPGRSDPSSSTTCRVGSASTRCQAKPARPMPPPTMPTRCTCDGRSRQRDGRPPAGGLHAVALTEALARLGHDTLVTGGRGRGRDPRARAGAPPALPPPGQRAVRPLPGERHHRPAPA